MTELSREQRLRAGLCGACRHSRAVTSGKGSVFWMCERSFADPRYRKYPPLPVLQCPGFEPEPNEND